MYKVERRALIVLFGAICLYSPVHALGFSNDAFESDSDPEDNFHLLDRLLEKSSLGMKVVLDVDAKRVADSLGFSTDRSWLEGVVEHLGNRQEFLELVLRYDTFGDKSIGGKPLIHIVAENSVRRSEVDGSFFPGVYSSDLLCLGLDGFQVNGVVYDGLNAFDVMVQRIVFAKPERSLLLNGLVLAFGAFYSCGFLGEKLDSSDVVTVGKRLIEQYGYDEGMEIYREFLGSISKSVKDDFFLANSMDKVASVFCNRWKIEGRWTNSLLYHIEKIFFNVEDVHRTQNLLSLLKAFDNPSDLNLQSKDGLSLVFQAYSYFDNEVLALYLQQGASADIPLSCDLFKLLTEDEKVRCGSTFSPRRGDTLLLAASLDPFRKVEAIPLLLKYTKKPDARDLLNRNALHRFLYHRVQDEQKHLLADLIKAGVDVNAKSVSGNTPSHVAVNRNAHLLPELLAHGADLHAKNNKGESPLDLLQRSIEEKWRFHEVNEEVLRILRGATGRKNLK